MSDFDGARLSLPVTARDHIDGAKTAAVTLVEYGDYECKFCGRAYPIVEAIRRDLGPQLRFVFRHFPITTIHRHAQHAAEAAETAAAQDLFWQMHAALFENQWALTDGDLAAYAAAIGLHVPDLEAALGSHRYADRVRQDYMSGVRSGVNGTPTFFINGIRHDGLWDYDALLEALTSALLVPVGARLPNA